MGKRVPAARHTGHFDGTVDPIHGKSDDTGGIRPEGELCQFQKVFHLGGELEFLIFTEGVSNLRLVGIQPEFLMFDFCFQFPNDIPV